MLKSERLERQELTQLVECLLVMVMQLTSKIAELFLGRWGEGCILATSPILVEKWEKEKVKRPLGSDL